MCFCPSAIYLFFSLSPQAVWVGVRVVERVRHGHFATPSTRREINGTYVTSPRLLSPTTPTFQVQDVRSERNSPLQLDTSDNPLVVPSPHPQSAFAFATEGGKAETAFVKGFIATSFSSRHSHARRRRQNLRDEHHPSPRIPPQPHPHLLRHPSGRSCRDPTSKSRADRSSTGVGKFWCEEGRTTAAQCRILTKVQKRGLTTTSSQ